MISPSAIAPLVGFLKWPLTIAGAVAMFGFSADGTFDLISANASKLSKPVEASPRFNVPPVRQIGTVEPTPAIASKTPATGSASTLVPPAATPNPEAATGVDVGLPSSVRHGKVGSKAVNVRSEPSKTSARLGTLQAGSPVEIGELSGGWISVRYPGGSGWVYSTYLEGEALASKATETASITVRGGAQSPAPPKPATQPKTGKLVEAGSRIVVRAAPDSGAESVFRLSRGERVRIVAREGKWAQIAMANGEGGWIRVK